MGEESQKPSVPSLLRWSPIQAQARPDSAYVFGCIALSLLWRLKAERTDPHRELLGLGGGTGRRQGGARVRGWLGSLVTTERK